MDETTKTDSSLILWGEIKENNSFDATNLWRPISEYKNTNVKHKRNINKRIQHSDLTAEDEEDMNDPVGSHTIALRKYYLYLYKRLQIRAKQKASEKADKNIKRKCKKRYLAFPEYPQKYPFSHSFDVTSLNTSRMLVKCNGEIPKYLLEKKITVFIKSVLEQTGYFDIEDKNMILNYLSAILDDFLQKFVRVLYRNKNAEPFSKDKDLWSALETTLRNFGIGGISAVHAFYYENVVKKHDILERKCKDMYNQLQKS